MQLRTRAGVVHQHFAGQPVVHATLSVRLLKLNVRLGLVKWGGQASLGNISVPGANLTHIGRENSRETGIGIRAPGGHLQPTLHTDRTTALIQRCIGRSEKPSDADGIHVIRGTAGTGSCIRQQLASSRVQLQRDVRAGIGGGSTGSSRNCTCIPPSYEVELNLGHEAIGSESAEIATHVGSVLITKSTTCSALDDLRAQG